MYQQYPIAETFGIPAPASMKVEGFTPSSNPFVPVEKPYLFRREPLRDALAFFGNPNGDGLYITGPTGSGKTSLIEQVAARLHWGVQAVAGHGRLEFNDLLGQFILTGNGTMKWIDGPLTSAVRHGQVLLINEIDATDPAELLGLNDIVEGKPLLIAATDEVVKPHPKFRLVATGNSAGAGDQSGLYQGVNRQSLAFMDRFRLMEVGYPEPADEMTMLEQAVPTMPVSIRERMIQLANEIRKVFIGGGDSSGLLSITMSTRGLLRWALLSANYKGAPNALAYALDRALVLRGDMAEREAIHRMAQDVFGSDWVV
ncbi:AAA family ATPase [Methylomonas sp. UP202]|uniref:AAA family ATPase n=1 Tax=Methylomonas sp. UP202 TaxID=3040943 RepID=UPI00247936BB|nr:AAA family ATPase [Methylomonas sp. UP202]WGS88607.1 AAA family ATPase [Methylomonas sp. UP202]